MNKILHKLNEISKFVLFWWYSIVRLNTHELLVKYPNILCLASYTLCVTPYTFGETPQHIR